MTRSVRAEVRFLNPEWRHRKDVPSIGDGASRRANTHKQEVVIEDARGMPLDLDTSGFILAEHSTAVPSFQDRATVLATYYAEIRAVVRRLTKADQVFVQGHTIRTEQTTGFNTAYARFLHCDYSLSGADARRSAVLDEHGPTLDRERHWEFAWYNTWQPIERDVYKNPLAVIDARSLDLSDVRDYWYTGPRSRPAAPTPGVPANASVSSMPVFNPRQRLFYFFQMRTHEMMVFKQLDTRAGRARGCPHTSFEIAAPPAAPGRRSIEVRTVCAFAG